MVLAIVVFPIVVFLASKRPWQSSSRTTSSVDVSFSASQGAKVQPADTAAAVLHEVAELEVCEVHRRLQRATLGLSAQRTQPVLDRHHARCARIGGAAYSGTSRIGVRWYDSSHPSLADTLKDLGDQAKYGRCIGCICSEALRRCSLAV